jgi:hypothetical protein
VWGRFFAPIFFLDQKAYFLVFFVRFRSNGAISKEKGLFAKCSMNLVKKSDRIRQWRPPFDQNKSPFFRKKGPKRAKKGRFWGVSGGDFE